MALQKGGGTDDKKTTHLENLFRILPAGVTSKKDIGDLKMAMAIRSCNFLDACNGWLDNRLRLLDSARTRTSMEQKIHSINV